jgi:hypothetical protein
MPAPDDADRPGSSKIYLGVIAVEAVVILLLWWLGRSFS